MTITKKTSALISQQLPDFVRDEGPKLEAFIKAYYEYLEQSNNYIEVSKSLLSRADVDTTVTDYFQYFRDEIFKNIPDDAVVNKALLAKHIREMYYQKGNEKSFKFLFRALYDEDLEVYFPSDNMLRTSDGRWSKPTVLRLTNVSSSDLESFLGQVITGQTSGATARVEEQIQTIELGSTITELVVSNWNNVEFSDGEEVVSDITNVTGFVYAISGTLQGVTIQERTIIRPRGFGSGVFHRSGDVITFTSDTGSGANGFIISTNDRSAINVSIISGGSGYINNLPIVFTGGSGSGAEAKVTSIGNTSILSICQDVISPMSSVILNTGPTFVSLGTNTAAVSANLAAANVSSSLINGLLFQNTETGTIQTISMINYGTGYSILPRPSVRLANVANEGLRDPHDGGIYGDNAELTAVYLPGSITGLGITNKGSSYSKFENIGIVNQSRIGTVNALASPIVSGVEIREGKYLSTKGFISWDQYLQNDYYQEFSYVLRSQKFVDTYREVVNNLLHPAGTKLFGTVLISNVLNVNSSIVFDTTIFINSDVGTPNSASIASLVEPPWNRHSGKLFIYNYTTLSPFVDQPTVGTGVPTTIDAFADISITDLNSKKLVFGNTTHFSSNRDNNNDATPGYIRQLTASPNTIIGNGTTFTTSFNVGDAIYARNEANAESVFVTVVSIANDTHMVTNGSLIHIGTTYYPNTLFAQTATNSSGSRLHYPHQITSQMDMIIFNSTGANTDGQYAINVVSSTSSGNVVMSLSSPYEGANLSQGVFAWISSGALSGRQL